MNTLTASHPSQASVLRVRKFVLSCIRESTWLARMMSFVYVIPFNFTRRTTWDLVDGGFPYQARPGLTYYLVFCRHLVRFACFRVTNIIAPLFLLPYNALFQCNNGEKKSKEKELELFFSMPQVTIRTRPCYSDVCNWRFYVFPVHSFKDLAGTFWWLGDGNFLA